MTRYKLPGLKQREIEACVCCGKGMAHAGNIDFVRVTLQRFLIDPGAVRRQTGLEMILGGGGDPASGHDRMAATIAHAMGPDEDIGIAVAAPVSVLICQPCALRACVLEMLEQAYKKKDPEANEPL
jgi:hypothetical protein